MAEFSVAHKINKKPTFHWWVLYILRKHSMIVSAVNARVKQVPHNYGIEVPCTVKEALAFYDLNGNHLWQDALNKKMSNLRVTFDILDENQHAPPGYSKASGHIIFDVRMILEWKYRWVKYGHRTLEPRHSTYAGVVSHKSVRIYLTYAALNHLDVCICDIHNFYLQSPSSEKHFIICGASFGLENVGC